jgi:hypothetical protein
LSKLHYIFILFEWAMEEIYTDLPRPADALGHENKAVGKS